MSNPEQLTTTPDCQEKLLERLQGDQQLLELLDSIVPQEDPLNGAIKLGVLKFSIGKSLLKRFLDQITEHNDTRDDLASILRFHLAGVFTADAMEKALLSGKYNVIQNLASADRLQKMAARHKQNSIKKPARIVEDENHQKVLDLLDEIIPKEEQMLLNGAIRFLLTENLIKAKSIEDILKRTQSSSEIMQLIKEVVVEDAFQKLIDTGRIIEIEGCDAEDILRATIKYVEYLYQN